MNTIHPSTTLRELTGLGSEPPKLSDSILLLVDYQNTYRTGVMALPDAADALAAGARLLERARAAGAPVVHIINDGGVNTPYDIRAEIGAISDEVAARDNEPVVIKQFPNAFHETELSAALTAFGAAPGSGKSLVIGGFMTHMCVSYTAQGAFNLGYRPTVVAETTATRALTAPDGKILSAAALHTAALTTIADLFGTVIPTVDGLPS